MSGLEAVPTLRGRRSECQALDQLLVEARTGRSAVLVLGGQPGIGKSALLSYALARAIGFQTTHAAGVESEAELAFAALHQICAPFLDNVERLPDPQRDALGAALGLHRGPTPDRFHVALAVLTLLTDAAEQQPMLVVVDDAQWLDQASADTLAFVGRRLHADPVAMLLAIRTDHDATTVFAHLPQLSVPGLGHGDALALLDTVLTGPLDDRVRQRIVAETRGNPLALLELPNTLTAAELSFGPTATPVAVPGASLTTRLEDGFVRRAAALPDPTRQLLLLASAEPLGDATVLWRAAAALGIPPDAAGSAQEAGLIHIGAQVHFRHPLVRSAIYRCATPAERHTAHHALADATDPTTDPDRRAWHRAQGTADLDEDVAAELEQSATRAHTRGGLAASAAFLQRATELTPDPARRARRALHAAQAKHHAGSPEVALSLLAVADAGPLDDLDNARSALLRAQVMFASTHGRDAPPMLLTAAKRLERLDSTLARQTYLDAFAAALFAGRLAAPGGSVQDVAAAVLAADWQPADGTPPAASELLLDGLAVLIAQGLTAGAPLLRTALEAFLAQSLSEQDELRWLWLACRVARSLGYDQWWDELTDRQVHLARRYGALSVLPIALTERFTAQLFAGDIDSASALLAEADAVIKVTGNQLGPHIAFLLAAWRGNEADTLALIESSRQDVTTRGEGLWLVATEWTSAVFFNGLGRYQDALVAAERAAQQPHELGLSTWVWPELIEAAARSGHPDRATTAMQQLTEVAATTGTDWTLGVAARSRALLTDDQHAEALYRDAIDRLSRTRIRVAQARTHLLYGEWLRRQGRRVDAREQLRAAHEGFTRIGMGAYAERARRELVATGETVRKRSGDIDEDQLTSQEAQIAQLAAQGHTNPEIGALLFISARTVEWHLRKVFTKLGITSRRQLRTALPDTLHTVSS
ncbi:AAA family ATPase (plasmid) [Rhodococcus opacus]|uniref:ATP-binding protein n=2 Tax=Rhodococcus opacus TaxID=37919 RepID=UPI001C9E1074|nr:LuxR family transcriptional regulator [Rhodococcus opacus]QZS52680.1 AAA family ATPase [Rhodococcus opacus]